MLNEFGKSTALFERRKPQNQDEISAPRVHQPATAIGGAIQKDEHVSKFLTGWKEIGNYLRKGVRTAQRYERRFALPVRRTSGKSCGPVLALPDEIDAWMAASQMRDGLRQHWTTSEAVCVDLATLERDIAHMRKHHQTTELRAELREIVRLLRACLPALDASQLSESKQGPVPVLPQLGHSYFCWICGNAVDLKLCVTDEHGIAVHENCYIARIMLASESIKLATKSPSSTDPVLRQWQNRSMIQFGRSRKQKQ